MELEFQVQLKGEYESMNTATANNEKDLQSIVDELVQDCKHIENVKISDMEEFATSIRGKFVMNSVIAYGLNVMENLPDRERPDSDIQDIKRIRDTIFKWK